MTEHLDVVILGAGISGVSAAWHLQDRCPTKSYAILERRDDLGGTWDLFKYPGIRSDSDMFTLGFRFKPWRSAKSIADGASIKAYIKEAAVENGIDRHIRYRHRAAGRRLVRRRQSLDLDRGARRRSSVYHLLVPVRPAPATTTTTRDIRPRSHGAEDFAGTIVHPQHWPEDLDYAEQENRRHRVRRNGRDPDPGAGELRLRPRDDVAALADLHRLAALGRPLCRARQPAAAEPRCACGESLESDRVSDLSVPARAETARLHAQVANDHG